MQDKCTTTTLKHLNALLEGNTVYTNFMHKKNKAHSKILKTFGLAEEQPETAKSNLKPKSMKQWNKNYNF